MFCLNTIPHPWLQDWVYRLVTKASKLSSCFTTSIAHAWSGMSRCICLVLLPEHQSIGQLAYVACLAKVLLHAFCWHHGLSEPAGGSEYSLTAGAGHVSVHPCIYYCRRVWLHCLQRKVSCSPQPLVCVCCFAWSKPPCPPPDGNRFQLSSALPATAFASTPHSYPHTHSILPPSPLLDQHTPCLHPDQY